MPSVRFAADNSEMIFALPASANMTAGFTQACIVRRRALAGAGAHYMFGHHTSGGSNQLGLQFTSDLFGGTDDLVGTTVNTSDNWGGMQISDLTNWYLLVATGQSGAINPWIHYLQLTPGSTWVHEVQNFNFDYSSGALGGTIRVGERNGLNDLDANVALIAGWTTYMTSLQVEAMFAGRNTADLVNDGTAKYVLELTDNVTVPDLMGNGATLQTVNGTTLDSVAAMPDTWTFGVAPPAPADSSGQYGWGTYGAGDYGPNFGGVSSTPISGSETHTMGESASVQITTSIGATDAASLAEALVLSGQYARVDSWTLGESAATTQQTDKAGSDAGTLSESATTTQQESKVASDAWVLSEATSLANSISASDSLLLTEAASNAVAVAATEILSMIEAAGLTAQIPANDSATQSESASSSQQTDVAGSESHAQTEGASLSATMGRVDSWALAEVAAVAENALKNASESHAQVEGSTAVDADLSAADSSLLSEVVNSVGEQALKAATDAWALGEAVSLSAALATSESHTLAEAAALTAALAAAESITASEAVGILTTLGATESHLTGEAATITTVDQKAASDAFTHAEDSATILTVDLKTAIDTFSAAEVATLAANVATFDVAALAEMAALNVAVQGSDSLLLAAENAALANALATGDAALLSEDTSIETVQFKAVAESFGLTEFALVYLPSPSPSIRRPTVALIIPTRTTAAITNKAQTASVAARTRTVVVAGKKFDVTVTEKGNLAVVASKMSSVDTNPETT